MPRSSFSSIFSACCQMLVAGLVFTEAVQLSAEEKTTEKPAVKAPERPAAPAVQLPAGITMERDVSYIENGDNAQKLDIYYPEKAPEQPLPLIVHIHGGGWMGGSKFPCPVLHMTTKGYVVASVEYRFSQKAKFPAQIQDCQAAIRWLRGHREKYHINPKHVGVIGGSAGGHLSALVGTAGGKNAFPKIGSHQDQSDAVQAVCDIFGPKNFTSVVQQAADDPNVRNIFKFNTPSDPYSELIGTKLSDTAKTDAVSPIHYLSKDTPPFLILHGTHDALVPYAQSEEFAEAAQEIGIIALLQKFPGSGHGGGGFGKPAVNMLTLKFFDKYLKGAEVSVELIPEKDLAVEPPKPPAR